ncbi:uncharacterized protein LOC141596656 [Silene latifolia]|uniref:uncharacterized protein LOC141596656 n=1 Tax=Silene latifolia TaxID=37657 RepID=UPI003D77442F
MHNRQLTTTTTVPTTKWDTKQILDVLPSYISFYQNSNPKPNRNPNTNAERTTILKWFATLSPPQRVAHLTIMDPTFTQLLLLMLRHVTKHNNHVTFFVLADSPGAPDLLTRRSRGLLARVADESTRRLSSSILLFSSCEGVAASNDVGATDTVSFREEVVADVDEFVGLMDEVSGGGFLSGASEEWAELGLEWAEMRWLKGKGYYSLDEFVANRVEVALRMAWLNSGGGGGGGGGRKRGVKLKEKVKNVVGLGINVYWRKRGCVDWWQRLDHGVKRKIFRTVLGTAAKSMTEDIIKDDTKVSDNDLDLGLGVHQYLECSYRSSSSMSTGDFLQRRAEFGLTSNLGEFSSKLPTSLVCAINRLIVLQAIIALAISPPLEDFDKEKIFFSSLGSVNSVSDVILRKIRGLLMVVSLDSTKFELLEEENRKTTITKSKEKSTATHRKKKGKNRNSKKSSTALKNSDSALVADKTLKVSESRSTCASTSGATLDVPDRSSSAEKGENVEKLQNSVAKKGKQSKKKLRGRLDPSKNLSAGMQTSLSSCSTSKCGREESGSIAVSKKASVDHCNCLTRVEKQDFSPRDTKFVNRHNDSPNSEVGGLGASLKDAPDPCAQSGPALNSVENDEIVSKVVNVNHSANPDICSAAVTPGESHGADRDRDSIIVKREESHGLNKHQDCYKDRVVSKTVPKSFLYRKTVDVKNESVMRHELDNLTRYKGPVFPLCYPSYEWPAAPLRLASFNSQHIPPATDRLHLEVGHNRQNHYQHPFIKQIHQVKSSIDGTGGRIMSRPLPASVDWPPILQTCSYDSTFLARQQATAQQGFVAQCPKKSAVSSEEDGNFSAECYDTSEQLITQEVVDDYDSHWVSEEEYEVHAVSGIDYNQFFGGGVMYWDPSDYRGSGFSRPPSLSSDDSSWAWREADMTRTVDDMVAFSSSYNTNGLNSPSAAPFCSPFESMAPVHQAIGYVRPGPPGNEGKMVHNSSTLTDFEAEESVAGSLASLPSDSDAKSGDSLPYPILRPIIIPNMPRDRSRSEFKGNHDMRSPRVPPNRREHPRIKRPPSPVVLCVPRAPRPPPPSPVGDSKKHRGFPTVRSGSSSPRQWGVRGWFHDGPNFEESHVRVDGAEVVWPSWGNTNFSSRQLAQPLPGAILQDRLIAISQLPHDQEHPDVALPLQPPELLNCPTRKASLPLMQNLLHDEIDAFCKQVATENLTRRPYINWAVKRVTRSLQVLWPRSRTNIFGSNASGLSLPTSDVDLVVCLPPVRNLEPIKEAGILEGRNSIKETCLQHAARYLGNQEWVKSDSLKTVENTAIPIIMLVVDVPHDLVTAPVMTHRHTYSSEQNQLGSGQSFSQTDTVASDNSPSMTGPELFKQDSVSVRLDISFKSPSHTGLQTTELVKQLTDQFPAAVPLALVLKQFLADRSLDQSYSGGLSSYCLVLLITRFLQHEHHLGRPINQNLGNLFMDFLYFFGNVFDPRQMRISIQGSGLYINRERGYSIDPIYIDDPLFPTNNVGRNCFRIHQCIKAFADAYSILESELSCLGVAVDENTTPQHRLLQKIIPSLSLP